MNLKAPLSAITVGIIITLLTGLISNTVPMLVGAIHYGYPLAWLTRLVIAPQYFPWRVDVFNLIVDIIVWSIIAGIIIFVFKRLRR